MTVGAPGFQLLAVGYWILAFTFVPGWCAALRWWNHAGYI